MYRKKGVGIRAQGKTNLHSLINKDKILTFNSLTFESFSSQIKINFCLSLHFVFFYYYEWALISNVPIPF